MIFFVVYQPTRFVRDFRVYFIVMNTAAIMAPYNLQVVRSCNMAPMQVYGSNRQSLYGRTWRLGG